MAADVDVNEFYGTINDLYHLAGVSVPPAPDEEEYPMTLKDDLKATRALFATSLTSLDAAIGSMNNPPPVPDPVVPPAPITPPVPSINIRVTRAPKAVAQYSLEDNGTGNPKMEPYPHGGTTDQRITWPTGSIVRVAPSKIQGDGGKFWQIVSVAGRNNEVLYFKEEDVTKV
jgi:hypothetical protein